MCGICGFTGPPDPAALRRMMVAMVHRGPDDEGTLERPEASLGIRRLSIIDLEGGAQPIYDENRTVAVVLNGEIYNFPKLRRELEERGHRFRTRTDTEVIVHLYEEEGKECVQRLRGMFAIAIYDLARDLLLLVRDRLGVKPLYYYRAGSRLIFASAPSPACPPRSPPFAGSAPCGRATCCRSAPARCRKSATGTSLRWPRPSLPAHRPRTGSADWPSVWTRRCASG
jgi:asparagine synthetase B (glutamine-hydrolysing)